MDRRSRQWLKSCSRLFGATRRLLVRLVIVYFERLDALPWVSARAEVRSMLLRTIERMYRAERRTLGGDRARSLGHLRSKCGLPFVVMALPAWLATDEFDPLECWRHMHWSYRLGLLFGYVDDAVDFPEDQRHGRPNLLSPDGRRASLTRRLARLAAGVRCPYRKEPDETEPMAIREALRTSIVSWFGGPDGPH